MNIFTYLTGNPLVEGAATGDRSFDIRHYGLEPDEIAELYLEEPEVFEAWKISRVAWLDDPNIIPLRPGAQSLGHGHLAHIIAASLARSALGLREVADAIEADPRIGEIVL